MKRYVLFVCAVVCVLTLVHGAGATTLDVNLDLIFANPNDDASGGNWTVSALAGDFGLAGIAFDVVPSNFAGNFLISNTIFEVQNSAPDGSGTGFIFALGDDLATPTLNVGVGSYVGLVTGTFDPGSVPALLNVSANLFDASATAVAVIPPNLTTSLTTNFIPEPTTLTWNQLGPGTFSYETAANWTPSQTPTANTDVVFPLDGQVDLVLSSTSVAKNVTVSDGVVKLKSLGSATFTSNGRVTVDDPLAANLAGGAFATLDGTDGTSWTTSLDLQVGSEGFGTFTVNNGGRWNGNDEVGSGSQEVMSITAERIEIRLSFTEPWESENLAFYNLRETNGGVEVTWGMEGDVPFPMNAMLIFDDMDESVGSDFGKGLESLKNRCEAMAGQQVNGYWIKKIDLPERTYIGKRETMTFDQIQAFFIENLPKIQEAINIKGFKVDGAPSGLFFDYDESAGTTDMAATIPTSGRKLYVDGYESIFGGRKALFLAYYGNYSNMAVPHQAMDAYMEQNNSGEHLLVIEEYITDPTLEPDTSKWLTNIYYVME